MKEVIDFFRRLHDNNTGSGSTPTAPNGPG